MLKCYMGDTGLLVTHAFNDNEVVDNDLYKEILTGDLNINNGMIFENAIAQALVANGYKLYFYTHYSEEKHRNDIEIDFIISNNSKVNYKIFADIDFICRFCDRMGGIDLGESSVKRRYFSAGLRQKLEEKTDYGSRLEITSAFFEKIAKIGLSSEDFMFIIEETRTNLVYSVCYDWLPLIKVMFSNYVLG